MSGIVVCPQPRAAEAGVEVLRRGGNAVDAAVTVAFCQGLLDPHNCGIGGSGLLLHHSAAEGRSSVVEFHARAGSGVRPDMWDDLFMREAADRYGYVLKGWVNDAGYQSVALPGTVAGLAEALRRFGSISWEQALGPAIGLAREGVAVSGLMAASWIKDDGPDIIPHAERMGATVEHRRIFTHDGGPVFAGEPLDQSDYGRTLEQLAREGPESFYTGDIARRMAADFEANGASISAADLAAYRPEVTEPVTGSYRGLELVVAGPPVGGVMLLQMLNYLEGFDVAGVGWPSVEAARLLVAAMGWAFADREAHLADPRFTPVPVDRLIDKAYAERARSAGLVAPAGPRLPDTPTTTHVCVIDAAGNAVSMTHTLGYSSGVVTPGLGFVYNNYLNCFDPRPGRVNSLAPGKTRVTMMTPALALDAGRLRYVIGAPGGTRIVTGVLQALVNLIDHRMEPMAAVSAPRIDFQGVHVAAENRVPSWVLGGLSEQGYAVQRRPMNYDSYFSRVQLAVAGAGGKLAGASDPRGDGGVALMG
jgi:gamma-glutamyltranspeptidase/glutathione hydrolase